MKINIYSIVKPTNDDFDKLIKEFIKMSSKYATVKTHYIFNNEIAKAQNIGEIEAKKIYTKTYLPYLKGYNIALDVLGNSVDSFSFSKLLEDKNEINFFIGGAYGFEKEFLTLCNSVISLSNLTFAHKVATLVLSEQVFRSLSILNNHPYHK
ncbi:23S rRNA (pseudouridine(1915)-N(3))-methyltransferase RlmH [Aliarcobacter trophiarum LMG 25534]|uniref:Ribosomal RNA large subunit methyltransferase H n=1 Tax=Aliarcobacter trophiarum LMG 25534 TaxID=1032241 RepID=A0AAD0QN44_9BACT|nr:23S rRNA (pseudouridine(1915)-N(3))-methyltransferase RlmH [Aliarcobacter trophiarum]AXK49370.1 SPOUT methyltransferase [Aliarcobacter trophiarum LMG 25534]RXI27824.1 23S rRNA (pseudouridine(1915)-N(3))-methyltransferase RlmH [Aliarcobacter trophiarum]RXJ92012.1 23S rRNA (pseudouridine(1915)-N(3))-methyltransferase RlmH [Aliarcobacter trophiarum LMG 25534]